MRAAVLLVSISGMALTGVVSGAAAGESVVDGVQVSGMSLEDIPVEKLTPDYRQIEIGTDSGPVVASIQSRAAGVIDHGQMIQQPIWSTIVRVEDADWLRLEFGQVDLSSLSENGRESYIRVTSLLDGYEQYLDFEALQVWGNTSAYFNGNAVRVEIMASAGTTTPDRVVIEGVQASAPVSTNSICFSTDDRVLSSDPRDARLMPIGCSAWLFSDHGSTFLTAAHCGPSAGDVVQFNVPLSSSGGGYRSPPPQDQYVLDGASVQASSGISLGNDWGFFGVFDNTDTGLTPLQAQGDSHTLATSGIPNDGRPIRITGYGTTSSPVPASWNGVQKTHVGPFRGYSGNVVRYTTDTTGGNSGSVILDDDNNVAIGIHTNAGCGTGGGWNNGCNLFNAGLQAALANPMGMAAPRTIQADLLPAPDSVSPAGGEVISLNVTNFHGRTFVGTPTMLVDSGSGYLPVASAMVDADTYEAVLPAAECGAEISYYFQATDTDGNTTEYPEGGAASAMRTMALDSLVIREEDDFQTDNGWVVVNTDVSDGQWQRLAPLANTSNGGPTQDADGSGVCFITGRGVVQDLDGGTTRLVSTFFDVTNMDEPTVSFWAWVNTADGEEMSVEFSPNLGIQWVAVDSIGDTNGWVRMQYSLTEFVDPSPIFTVRFTISDEGANSLVEAGVDGFRIADEICNSACEADFTDDGVLDFFDISAFLSAYGAMDPQADYNSDGSFDFFDISSFLTAYGAGCP
ncbi:MAG: trypsin-like peptidase domain-containing protein [Phycisphaerales bacterium]|nr:trypsin-like peptidase domain-containing protein [Phycisphaerales bacterium]